MSERDFPELIRAVQDGDENATSVLVEKLSTPLLQLIHGAIPEKLNAKFDDEDFLQATWAEIFAEKDKLSLFKNEQEFFSFVSQTAKNIVTAEVRRCLQGQKHNVNREESLDESQSSGGATWLTLEVPDVDNEVLKAIGDDEETRKLIESLGGRFDFRSVEPNGQISLYINPGNAQVEHIQNLMDALSDLHRAYGGLGLEFDDNDDVVLIGRGALIR